MSATARLGLDPSILNPAPQDLSENQAQTRDTFAFIWSHRDGYESPAVSAHARQWLWERYCDHDPSRIDQWLAGGRKLILDAGCGSGFGAILFFGDRLKDHDYLGVDVSDAVEVAKVRFHERGYPGEFMRRSVTELPLDDGTVDLIYSDGVLHHTDSTEEALVSLAAKIRTGGRFLFYVYAKKAVIREFTDDHIRNHLARLTNEEAWEALKPLTRLGIALGELNVEIDVPEDIPYLGIKKGKMDLQRFFFWNVCKAFYRPEFEFHEMNLNNYDWFRPLNCHRHTPEEVEAFCRRADLDIEHMNVQEAGITVVARKL